MPHQGGVGGADPAQRSRQDREGQVARTALGGSPPRRMSLRLPPRADVRLLATAVALPTDLAPVGQRGRVMDEAAVLAHIGHVGVPGAEAANATEPQSPLDAEVTTRQWVQDADAIDLAVEAGRRALARAGLQGNQLSAVLCASSTPGSISAALAPRVVARLQGEAADASIFLPCAHDVRGGGVGALQAWITAQGLIAQGAGPVLVVAAETPSKFLQPGDVGTALRYGDGAGAVILGPAAGTDLASRPGASFLGGLAGQRPLAGGPPPPPRAAAAAGGAAGLPLSKARPRAPGRPGALVGASAARAGRGVPRRAGGHALRAALWGLAPANGHRR